LILQFCIEDSDAGDLIVYELSEYGLRGWLRRVEGVIDRGDTPRVEDFLLDLLCGDGDGVCVVTRGIDEFLVTFLFGDGDGDFIIGVADDGLGDAIEEFLADFLYGDGLGDVEDNGFGDNIEGIEELLVEFLYGDRTGDLTLPGDVILGITDRRLGVEVREDLTLIFSSAFDTILVFFFFCRGDFAVFGSSFFDEDFVVTAALFAEPSIFFRVVSEEIFEGVL